MIELDFAVRGVEIAPHSATPLLLFKLHVANRTPAVPVEHVSLQTQLRIEAARREYDEQDRERLVELFGGAVDWERNLRALLWANAGAAIPPFDAECTVDLSVPCSSDFTIAATKYFNGLEGGEAPLLFLFSGTVFHRDAEGDLQISQIAHDKEAACRMPVTIWHRLMERYYGNSVWLSVDRDLFEAIHRYKRQNGIATIDDALRRLVAAQLPAEVPS
ncbi:MAG TPA: DUF6084 family protein [Stellaceae bacterium]|nr:DUF6084 family protein [Stellaceae bacterium]